MFCFKYMHIVKLFRYIFTRYCYTLYLGGFGFPAAEKKNLQRIPQIRHETPLKCQFDKYVLPLSTAVYIGQWGRRWTAL